MYISSLLRSGPRLASMTSAPAFRNRASFFGLKSLYTTQSETPSQVIGSWSKKVLNEEIPYNDNIDGRRLAFLWNALAPHMPNSYPPLDLDPVTKEAKSGTPLFPNSHLVYFWIPFMETELSYDGYFAGEAPPPPFKQRVWAGGSLEFNNDNPLLVGQKSKLVSAITKVAEKYRDPKAGGPLAMVQMKRSVYNETGPSMVETRELAYMMETNPNRKNVMPKQQPDASHTLRPTEITLFRYSALTWNSHRIHYDLAYTQSSENHPAVLVHGPLTCTLLLEFLRCHSPADYYLKSFKYRAVSPLYVNNNITLCIKWTPSAGQHTKECELWALNGDGGIGMSGKATLHKIH